MTTVDPSPPMLAQVNLVVRDMEAALAFYRILGLPIDANPQAGHAEVEMASGFTLELDSYDSVAMWDSAWRGPAAGPGASGCGGQVVLGFALATRQAVDDRLWRTHHGWLPWPSGSVRRLLGEPLCHRRGP
jgi:catechol 2,3-dioxygenase-like lactoylglutathione lyase family enzyme